MSILNETKLLLKFSLPLTLSYIINAAANLVTMYFMATLGSDALAAGALITSTYGFITMLATSLLFAVGIEISKLHSKNNWLHINRELNSAVMLAIITAIPCIILFLSIYPLFITLKQPVTISLLSASFFRGLSFGVIPSFVMAAYLQLWMGMRESRLILRLTILSLIINSLITFLLIHYLSASPLNGSFYAGFSNAITAWVMLTLIIAYCSMTERFKHIQHFSLSAINRISMMNQFKFGLPISIQYATELAAFVLITYLMGYFGKEALAAHQITLQTSTPIIMIMMAISQASSILISQAQAANQPQRLRWISAASLAMGIMVTTMIAVIFIFFPTLLIRIYLDMHLLTNKSIITLTKSFLFIIAFTQLFDALRNITAGLLRGLGDSKTSLWTGLIACWMIGMPGALYFAFISHHGAAGLRLGMLLGIMIGCAHLLYKLYYKLSTHTMASSIAYETNGVAD